MPGVDLFKEHSKSLVIYYATLALYVILPQFPPMRLWAFDLWRYLPPTWVWTLFAFGAIAPLVLLYLLHRKSSDTQAETESETKTTGKFLIISGAISVLFLVSFVLFSAKTHFMGDGYTLLSQLSGGHQIVKWSNMASMLFVKQVFEFLPDSLPDRATVAYQVLSFTGGIAYLGLSMLLAVKSSIHLGSRLMLFIGMATSGVALLFFGYVENYALFASLVLLYVILGALAVEARISPYWTLLLLPVMFLFHIFAVMFVPPTVYLLIRNRKWWKRLVRSSWSTKGLLVLIGLIASFIAYYVASRKYIFLRYSVLPIIEDKYTVSGYTMFSPDHLLDIVNLLFLMIPGSLVLVAGFRTNWTTILKKNAASRFLLVTSAFAAVTLIVFDPKLGMPRDWDLFSFVAIPLTLFLLHSIFLHSIEVRRGALVIGLAVTLALLTLTPRVYTQTVPQASITQVIDYFRLDLKKSMQYVEMVQKYAEEHGDSQTFNRMGEFFQANYPEKSLNAKGQELLLQGRYAEAIPVFEQAIAINPRLVGALFNKGLCLSNMGRNTEALEALEMASGFSPYNEKMYANLAFVQLKSGHTDDAFDNATRAYELDHNYLLPITLLIQIYKSRRELEHYETFLMKGISHPDATPNLLAEATQFFISKRDMVSARKALSAAIARGLDSSTTALLSARIR